MNLMYLLQLNYKILYLKYLIIVNDIIKKKTLWHSILNTQILIKFIFEQINKMDDLAFCVNSIAMSDDSGNNYSTFNTASNAHPRQRKYSKRTK